MLDSGTAGVAGCVSPLAFTFPVQALSTFRMKIVLRTLLYLALIVWMGAEIFFPIVAAITFGTLQPDTHAAGTIVGQLLRILHNMGLVSGAIALALLALAPAWGIYKSKTVLAPMVGLVLMIACTCYSQYSIIPSMERDRIAAGGDVNAAEIGNPSRIHFNQLHVWSERVEEAVLLLGLATVALVARAETVRQ
jgi:hypothetical protein